MSLLIVFQKSWISGVAESGPSLSMPSHAFAPKAHLYQIRHLIGQQKPPLFYWLHSRFASMCAAWSCSLREMAECSATWHLAHIPISLSIKFWRICLAARKQQPGWRRRTEVNPIIAKEVVFMWVVPEAVHFPIWKFIAYRMEAWVCDFCTCPASTRSSI